MTPIRIGLLRLLDSAPVIAARAHGLFASQGIAAALAIEPSWANVLDKLAYGVLDAAVLPASLAIAAALGLRGRRTPLLVPLGISLGGNAVVVAPAVAAAVTAGASTPTAVARRLVAWMAAQPEPPRFAVVHALSTHNLLLRDWLASAGADPDRIMRTVVVPPERVVGALAAGDIAGFCAGAPWGDAAQFGGQGQSLLGGLSIWPDRPEKCLAVSQAWLDAAPEAVTGLLRALLRAGQHCDRPEAAAALARLLAQEAGLPEAACRAGLRGGNGIEAIRFAAARAWLPVPDDGRWFAGQFKRWGWLPESEASAAAAVYRPDLLRDAATAETLTWPDSALLSPSNDASALKTDQLMPQKVPRLPQLP